MIFALSKTILDRFQSVDVNEFSICIKNSYVQLELLDISMNNKLSFFFLSFDKGKNFLRRIFQFNTKIMAKNYFFYSFF